MIRMGAVGVISVIGNACIHDFTNLVHLSLKGEYPKAETLQGKLQNVYKLLTVDGNPSGIKSLLSEQGKIKNILRLPLVPASSETQKKIHEYICDL